MPFKKIDLTGADVEGQFLSAVQLGVGTPSGGNGYYTNLY